jgi:hypothetical protein
MADGKGLKAPLISHQIWIHSKQTPTIVPIAHQDEDGRNVQQYNVFGILVDVEQF